MEDGGLQAKSETKQAQLHFRTLHRLYLELIPLVLVVVGSCCLWRHELRGCVCCFSVGYLLWSLSSVAGFAPSATSLLCLVPLKFDVGINPVAVLLVEVADILDVDGDARP